MKDDGRLAARALPSVPAASAVATNVVAPLLALALASCVLAAGSAEAQRGRARDLPAPAPDTGDAAREHFMRGVELFDEGDHDAALAEFRQSYELSPVPGVLVNVAVSLVELDRYDEAVETYRRYLREAVRASAERRAQIEAAIETLEARLATLTVEVDRPGAEILIDGRSAGTTPLASPLRVAEGSRVIEIRLEGFVPVREEIELAGREERSLSLRLAPVDRNGLLRVVAEPSDATVRIDGLEVGHAPLERRLPMGGHVIEASLETFRTWRSDVQLGDHQELVLRITMERDGPDPAREWWFWTILGVGVLGAAAAITGGVVCGTTDACTSTVVIPGNIEPGVIRL